MKEQSHEKNRRGSSPEIKLSKKKEQLIKGETSEIKP